MTDAAPTQSQALRDYRDRLRDLPTPLPARRRDPAKQEPFNPYRTLAVTFLALIALGTLLLCSPWAQSDGCWAWLAPGRPFTWAKLGEALIDNLFMATSASCVTGLAVVTVPETYTFFGQAVLLGCVQLGGISLVALGTLIVSILLGRVPFGGERQIAISFGSSGRPASLLSQTFRYVLTFEAVGAALLFVRYHFVHGYELGRAVWFSVFHAVSAFCNAGLSLHPNNLLDIRGDAPLLIILALLVAAGGIGFLVLSNVFRYRFWRRDLRRRGHIILQARVVLWMSLILSVGGGLLFTALEWRGSLVHDPSAPGLIASLADGAWRDALVAFNTDFEEACAGFAQAIFFRTAGFNAIPMGEVSHPANVLSVLLMLVGGAPGSMAGGIKTTTLVVVLLTIRAYIRGNPDVQLHRRTIPDAICREAMVILFFYLATLFLLYFLLLFTEDALIAKHGEFALFYEVSSALGTVGTTLDATGDLSQAGRLLISLTMFLGRIGPVSLALMMASRAQAHHVRYPEESISVG